MPQSTENPDLHLECVVQVIKGDQNLPVTLTQVSVEQKRTFKPYIRHPENVLPGSFTGDHLPNMAQHGWRNVAHIELDKVLACGPTKDPMIHRGLVLDEELKKWAK
ncbi:hypothetical protein DdX_19008 [Ditylenchus destructor]|uniref:Uncharacterized protein n=1 Tax=Ditylenchus destructor TaxID=166010 RepID=A0AAD4MNX3_9BILA|nr:hypothetical protein DdX_19008 [Ditylenchus destructor]